ncbi:hypothetical protein N7492_005831 [Penicillium capsulatum]|uniref:MARVEL domain-containing protein n=1 Tax=Penicillium capsulatum TaxID=69766 RepID=A0A9W9ICR0_9EURO|nr:hypothetical protein N7492_005831 [Penicillium capsulatum]KAJ6135069.1 hypothetical protein N7512_000229 [Penicillium capsulatum]
MRSRSVKPSAYPAIPFHGIRFIAFLSSIVVGIILAVFIYHLHADGYKLPFAFLILLIAAILSILNLIFTTVVNCSCGLSTKLSIFLNVVLILLWALSLGLMSYAMYGTIMTSCTTEYWGNATGINVCRTYKALFTFTALGLASHIAALALDAIVRRRQNRFGAYGPMSSTPGLGVGEDPADVKMADRHPDAVAYDTVPPLATGAHPYSHSYSNSMEYTHAPDAHQYHDDVPMYGQHDGPRVRFNSYDQAYSHPAPQTSYDPAGYR